MEVSVARCYVWYLAYAYGYARAIVHTHAWSSELVTSSKNMNHLLLRRQLLFHQEVLGI